MRILIAGGTGVIGRPAVRQLAAAGHDVIGVAHRPSSAAFLREVGAAPVEVDLFDRDAVVRAAAGADAVINLATAIPPTAQAWRAGAWATTHRLRREAAGNLAAAAREHGARFVQESLAFQYEDGGAAWLDEEAPLAPAGPAEAMLDAEAAAASVTASGGVGVSLRFGQFYAAASDQTREVLQAARKGLAMFFGPDDAYWPMVHAEDAAAAVVASLDAPPGTYNVVDDAPLSRAEHTAALARAVGRATLRRPPRWVARGPVASLARSERASNRRFRGATDWAPRFPNMADGWAQVVEELGP